MSIDPFAAAAAQAKAQANPFDQNSEVDPNQEVIEVPVEVATSAEKLAGAPEAPDQPSAAVPKGPRQQRSAREKAQQVLDRLTGVATRSDALVAKLETALANAKVAAEAAGKKRDHQATHPDLQD